MFLHGYKIRINTGRESLGLFFEVLFQPFDDAQLLTLKESLYTSQLL